jgi:hypothetical protein
MQFHTRQFEGMRPGGLNVLENISDSYGQNDWYKFSIINFDCSQMQEVKMDRTRSTCDKIIN